MLTLREPIQLKTGLGLTAFSDSFCQRLTGNYGLMTARVAPKDLLFLLTAAPELPEDLGGGVSMSLQNSFTDVRNVTMDVVNNVVNRIVLENENRFTYQDQVYITTVLRKLGVVDVERFMEEARRLREEQRSQLELTRLYSRETVRRALAGQAGAAEGRKGAAEAGPGETEGGSAGPRYYLHQDIYRRLRTGDVYREVSAFQQNVTREGDTLAHNALRLSEQLRISNSLRLEESKRQALYGGAVTLRHHVNHYEQGDLLPPPATEAEVLAQAAEAALLSTVDKVATHVLERERTGRPVWMRLEHSLSQTAEHSLSRFEYYHSEGASRTDRSSAYSLWYQTLEREEIACLQRLTEHWREERRIERALHGAGGPAAGGGPAVLEHRIPAEPTPAGEVPDGAGAAPGPGLSTRELTTLTQRILSGGKPETGAQPPRRMPEPGGDTLRETRILRERELREAGRTQARTLLELAGLEREVLLLEQENQRLTDAEASLLPPLPTLTPGLVRAAAEAFRPAAGGGGFPPVERTLSRPAGAAEEAAQDAPQSDGARGGAYPAAPAGGARTADGAGFIPPQAARESVIERVLRENRQHTQEILREHAAGAHVLAELTGRAAEEAEPYGGNDESRVEETARTAEEAPTRGAERRDPAAVLREARRRMAEEGAGPGGAAAGPAGGENLERVLRESRQHTREILRERAAGAYAPAELTGRLPPEAEPEAGARIPGAAASADAAGTHPAGAEARDAAAVLREVRRRMAEQAGLLSGAALSGAEREEREDRLYHTPEPGGAETPAGGPARDAAPAPDPALLERELRVIDRQNRERYERIQEALLEHVREGALRPAADPGRTMAEALRAVQEPDKVLQQLLESAGAPERPEIPPEVEQILRQADPETREIYQTLIRYQRDPASVADQGLVRPGSVGALNAEAALRQAPAPALEHPAAPVPGEAAAEPEQRREALLETLRELPQRGSAQPRRRGEWGKAPIVLHREDTSFLEELVERLEERRVRSAEAQVVREDVTRTHASQVQINDQTTQTVTQSTEDITALINRTMARQMNAITDKVYRQMEKKLQTERSRRGRI